MLLSRRDTCLLALSPLAAPVLLPTEAQASGISYTQAPVPIRQLKENFGVAVLLATEESLVETGKVSQYDLQKEFFKLRQQEFAPLKKANFGGLRTLPQELNVNDVPYFNFQSYIQWKVVARKIHGERERMEFNKAVGRRLLTRFLPNLVEESSAMCPGYTAGSRPFDSSNLDSYVASTSEDPALWWDTRVTHHAWGVAQAETRPRLCAAGIESAVSQLLGRLKVINFVEDYNVEWAREALGTSSGPTSSATLTVRLKAPADLEGGVLIRAEENFWQRVTSSMLLALFEKLGVDNTVDEYFSRETYKPKSLLEQAVLALGDPLLPIIDNVDVDSITETWKLSWS